MKRAEQRCWRHSSMGQEEVPWRAVEPYSWDVWKPCKYDGRRLVTMRGRYMTYGSRQFIDNGVTVVQDWRGTMDIDVP